MKRVSWQYGNTTNGILISIHYFMLEKTLSYVKHITKTYWLYRCKFYDIWYNKHLHVLQYSVNIWYVQVVHFSAQKVSKIAAFMHGIILMHCKGNQNFITLCKKLELFKGSGFVPTSKYWSSLTQMRYCTSIHTCVQMCVSVCV